MHHGVPRQVDVLGKAAPQVGRLLGRRVAVADRIGIVAPVGILAVAVLAEMAPLALAAGDVVLDEHEVALAESLAPGELAAGLGDHADVLVAHDDRRVGRRLLVELDVGAADAGHLHLHEGAVGRDVRHGKLAQLRPARTGTHRRQNLLCHLNDSSPSRPNGRSSACLPKRKAPVKPARRGFAMLSPCSAHCRTVPSTATPWIACARGRAIASASVTTPPSWWPRCHAAFPAVRRARPWWRSGSASNGTSSGCSSRPTRWWWTICRRP